MRSPLSLPLMAALICVLQICLSFAAEPSQAQTRKPTGREIASIRDCVTRNKDNLDEGERQCLFNSILSRSPASETHRKMPTQRL
jgi:hypothetical protein